MPFFYPLIFRVNFDYIYISTVDEVKSRDTNLVLKLASLHNLSVTAFGDKVFAPETSSYGSLTLADAFDTALESAPVTPTGPNAVPYKLLSGTIKTTYNAHRKFNSMEGVTVVPGVLGGNTGLCIKLFGQECTADWKILTRYIQLLEIVRTHFPLQS